MAEESSYHIRVLGPEDAEEFKELRLRGLKEAPHAFGSSYEESAARPVSHFAERITPDKNGFVMGAFEGKLVGVTGFYRYQDGIKSEHKGVLWGVYLLPECRGRGIAKKLMLSVIEGARALPGIELIHLGVNPANPPVVKLYESVGFTKWGEEKHALKVDGQYVDEDQMVLWL